jgi:hypothetical protein
VGLLLLQQIEAVLVLIQLYKNIYIKKLFNYRLVSLALKLYTFKSLCINGLINKKLKLSSFSLHHSLVFTKWRVNSLNQIMSYSIQEAKFSTFPPRKLKTPSYLIGGFEAGRGKEGGYQESSFLE